ncbi:hypothetical protein [Aliarcobacter butzleri]|nr:hypothetical protein [Aliarcobacter butzleri]
MKQIFHNIDFLKSTIEVIIQIAITSIFSHFTYFIDLISQLSF